MSSKLPPRPNLDHLRRQAKSLLAALAAKEPAAIETFREHLPAARKMSDEEIIQARFRLADAQSAISRKTGFANWPQLARHVEQLRALEGTWEFESLEVDGRSMPASMLTTSRILIDGDRFRSETPGAIYEGVFNIDVEAKPHGIDIEFVEGPEAGNTNRGIFRLDGDRLTICLDMNGNARPEAFRTKGGSGHALELLRRTSASRPDNITGGVAPVKMDPTITASEADFEYRPSPTLERLQGEWSARNVVRDGQALPSFMCATGLRSAKGNEVKVSFGGQVMVHALVRVDESSDPIQIDYFNLSPAKGALQQGIMRWEGDEACFCMAAPGQPRPTDFSCAIGSRQTLSQWGRKK